MTRGQFGIGSHICVCEYEFLIIDARSELSLEFEDGVGLQGAVRVGVFKTDVHPRQ